MAAFISGETDTIPELGRIATVGTPEIVRQQVQAYIDAGIRHFMLWFLDAPSDAGMTLFAEQVLPYFQTSSTSG